MHVTGGEVEGEGRAAEEEVEGAEAVVEEVERAVVAEELVLVEAAGPRSSTSDDIAAAAVSPLTTSRHARMTRAPP